MVSIPSAFSDGTYGSISIHHTDRWSLQALTFGKHASHLRSSVRSAAYHLLLPALMWMSLEMNQIARRGKIRPDNTITPDTEDYRPSGGIRRRTNPMPSWRSPISRSWILIGRCRIYLNRNVCIHVYSIDCLIGWTRQYNGRAGIYSFDTRSKVNAMSLQFMHIVQLCDPLS